MALSVSSLNSGSNGNCYYIGNETEAVLVDAGISCREIEKRMSRLELSIEKIKAVFISHEHSDHIRGVELLSRKYRLPVYISQPTLQNSPLSIPGDQVFPISEKVTIGRLTISAFAKHHDAADPYSFTVDDSEVKVGILTDIGHPCDQTVHYFKQCNAAFLESNYDEQMLEEGNYPSYLKFRIRGGKGHLSNNQALELFKNHRSQNLSHLFLSHLSKNNNCPALVQRLFKEHSENTNIIIASRYSETPVYTISKGTDPFSDLRRVTFKSTAMQMNLFE